MPEGEPKGGKQLSVELPSIRPEIFAGIVIGGAIVGGSVLAFFQESKGPANGKQENSPDPNSCAVVDRSNGVYPFDAVVRAGGDPQHVPMGPIWAFKPDGTTERYNGWNLMGDVPDKTRTCLGKNKTFYRHPISTPVSPNEGQPQGISRGKLAEIQRGFARVERQHGMLYQARALNPHT